jgi:uncharacterized ion transporter superfamily protein YfcC
MINTKSIAIVVIFAVIAMMIGTTALVEAGRFKVSYDGVDTYFGKGKIVIKNLDNGKTLVSEKLNFAKQHNSQGKSCCVKTYDFKDKGNHNGDELQVRVTANGGSWSQPETFHTGTIKVSVSMDEVNCGDDC